MNSSPTPRSSPHAAKARPRNSAPVSNTMRSGKPLSLAIRSSTRRTRNPAQRSVNFNRRTFPRAIVYHRQHANHSSRTHAITDKIHRPLFVRPTRRRLACWPNPSDSPSLPDPHRQALLAIQAIHALVIDCRPFAHQHCRQPPISEPHALGSQLFQSCPQPHIALRFPRPISIGRTSHSQQPAGVPLTHLVLHFHITHGCPKSRRHYQFFESTSFSARLSSVRSATTCLSFRFSSSSCFSFLASLLSIPPYFAFQR